MPEVFANHWSRTNGDLVSCIRAVLDAHVIQERRRAPLQAGIPEDAVAASAKALAIRVALEFGYTGGDVFGRSRLARICRVRELAMWLVRDEVGMSYPEIGRLFGKRDHTTVICGCNNARAELARNHTLEARLRRLAKAHNDDREAARVAA